VKTPGFPMRQLRLWANQFHMGLAVPVVSQRLLVLAWRMSEAGLLLVLTIIRLERFIRLEKSYGLGVWFGIQQVS
jgi:hypothetical protein